MGNAKWYELTPARQQLLMALVCALLALSAILGHQLDCAGKLRDAQQDPEQTAPDR